ncbi:MAG: phosphate:Na+ symporter [Clostridia bacterium]|nr:phosphate:Na+ symporter [Clostridia bacterium]
MSIALLQLSLGVGLLLMGMQFLRQGLAGMARHRFEQILRRAASTPWRGLCWGTLATALVQSSTAATVFTVGLVDAGLISFRQSLGLILGANIGTCVTVQILAFDLEELALPMLLVSLLLLIPARSRPLGLTLLGTGMIFLSLSLLTQALQPWREAPALLGPLAAAAASPWQGLLAGVIVTALLHSSSAVTSLTMILAAQGLLPLPAALTVVLGANIGTCITALAAAVFASRAAQQTALAHFLLNIFGAFIFLPFLGIISSFLSWLSPSMARQIAHFHTFFNVATSLAALPLVGALAGVTTWILPENR